MYKERPFLVTLICLFLVGWDSYLMVNSFAFLKNGAVTDAMALIPLPYVVQVAMLYVNWIMLIVAGMLMMQEKNWGRWLFLGWGFIYIDYLLYTQHDWRDPIVVMPIAFYLVFAFILLMPSANEFFQEEKWV